MSTHNETKSRKSKTNYLTQIFVVALLLFVLGIFANLIYHSYLWSNELKSMQYLRIELTNEASVEELKNTLSKNNIIREVVFVSKDEGLEMLKNTTNTDPTALLDKNPLPNLFNAFIKANSTPVAIEKEVEELKKMNGIASVTYKKNETILLDKMITKISWVMFILVAILLLVSVFIIDSTVRLALFSKRMTIRSMQLIGATKGFIRKPYILKSILNGFISGMIAVILIAIIYGALEYSYPKLNLLKELVFISLIAGSIIIIGMVFTMISTIFSLRKYLRMKLDDLY